MAKYYAVRIGKTPGIYNTWDECKANTQGYPNATFKSFKTLDEAKAYLEGNTATVVTPSCNSANCVPETIDNYSFVDGSYNSSTKVYGCGGFLIENGNKHIIQASDNDEEMASMRNVAGEILGSTLAVKKAIELGLSFINIYYDYAGIEAWANGDWKTNKKGTVEYKDFINEARKKIEINFIKVKGHSGIEGNEEADRLAKESVGII